MENSSRRWTVQDRSGNNIYLTNERWQHIVGDDNHPELADYEHLLQETLRSGRRRQEPLNQRKYRYYRYYSDLPDEFNHVIVIVLFGLVTESQQSQTNNYVATAFFNYMSIKN